MKLNKSYKMMPVLLGLSTNSLLAKTELLFSESDIIRTNYIEFAKSSIIAQHEMQISSHQFVKSRFNDLYKNWYFKTMFYSNPKMIVEDENFQSIVNMGEQAIPLILEKIESEPSQLVWALNIITNKKISNNSMISITDACKSWVKLGKQNLI
jgi:hypothetical protein